MLSFTNTIFIKATTLLEKMVSQRRTETQKDENTPGILLAHPQVRVFPGNTPGVLSLYVAGGYSCNQIPKSKVRNVSSGDQKLKTLLIISRLGVRASFW